MARRRFVAWSAHAPGLRWCYGESLPARLRPANAIAVIATVIAIVAAILGARGSQRVLAGLAAWLAGHVAWGTYLAWRLPEYGDERRPDRRPRPRALRCDAGCRPAEAAAPAARRHDQDQ